MHVKIFVQHKKRIKYETSTLQLHFYSISFKNTHKNCKIKTFQQRTAYKEPLKHVKKFVNNKNIYVTEFPSNVIDEITNYEQITAAINQAKWNWFRRCSGENETINNWEPKWSI